MITFIIFIFAFGILVLVHEFGHFYLAKKTGVKVEEFSIGFPPRILKWRRKETLYSIGIIPFGGFVKLEGEQSENIGFRAQKPLKKIVVAGAGVVFNLLLAYFLFAFALLTVGLPKETGPLQILNILPGSLGEKYFTTGDIIEKAEVNGYDFFFSNSESFVNFIRMHLGEKVTFFIIRNNIVKKIEITLPNRFDSQKGALGIYVTNYGKEKASFPENFWLAYYKIKDSFSKAVISFYYLILKLFGQTNMSIGIVGPVGIYTIFQQLYNIDWTFAIQFLATISIYLAIMNFLPLPGLDGFQMFLAVLEAIRGKRLKFKVEAIIIQTGLALLFFLLFLVTIKDIKNLLQ